MEALSFKFGGEYPPFSLKVINKEIGRIAPIQRKNFLIPGRPGAVSNGYETGIRSIGMTVDFEASSKAEWLEKFDILSGWLIREKPVTLEFESEPGIYMAELEGDITTNEINIYGQAQINFICTDPYKYTAAQTADFSGGQVILHNAGHIPTFPIIRATALQNLTHLQVIADGQHFLLGNPNPVGAAVVQREERLLNDNMASLVGWGTAGLTVDGGTVAGSFETNGFSVGAASYGADTITGWRGPAMKKSVPQAPLTDFKIRLPIVFKNPSIEARGRIELQLLDEQSVDFGKIAMKRTGGGAYGNIMEARAGGGSDFKYFANYAGVNGIEWRDFDGVLEISRIDNEWKTYTAMVDPVTKKHTARQTFEFTDTQRKYMRNLAQVQLHIARNGMAQPMTARIEGLEVFRINPVTLEETPVMAVTGDEIEINMKTKKIYVNGRPRPDLKEFGSRYFPLPKGDNSLLIDPAAGVSASVEWEEGSR